MPDTTATTVPLAFPEADPAAALGLKRSLGLIPASAAASPAAAAVAAFAALALKPGVERWPVKTGVDDDIAQVGILGVVDTSVEELRRIARPTPEPFPDAKRELPVETTVWRLTAEIIELKLEADGDYHLVLQGDSGETMIGEIPTPDPPFINPPDPWIDAIRAARKAVKAKLVDPIRGQQFVHMGPMLVPSSAATTTGVAGDPVTLGDAPAPAAAAAGAPPTEPAVASFKTKIRQRATVTGVGFFDRLHGQDGVAPNGIELHPVLKIDWPPAGGPV
jgi:hypothetical protein